MQVDEHIQLIIDEIGGINNQIICNYDNNFPITLYKYRNFGESFHRDIIKKNCIYLASPLDFIDKFDCHVPEDVIHGEALIQYMYRYSRDHNHNFDSCEHFKWAYSAAMQSPIRNKKLFKAICQNFYSIFCDIFGVLSLTSSYNNDYMWTEYGENHKGFCIGFDSKKLYDSIKGGCGPVQYVDVLPTVHYLKDDNMVQLYKNVYFKFKKFKIEDEFRMHKMWPHTVSSDERNVLMAKNTIKEVILGKKMPKDHKIIMRRLVQQYCLSAEIIEL